MSADGIVDTAGLSTARVSERTWTDCSRYCQGVCPCPDPPWLWQCNKEPEEVKVRDPQRIWTPGYLRTLPFSIWNGDVE